MKKSINIKPSDMDMLLRSLKEPNNVLDSKRLDGNNDKNLEIIRLLEKDGYVDVRFKCETNNHVSFSITEKGKFFILSGGYVALAEKERWKKVKEYLPNLIKFVLGFLLPKIIFLIFHIINLQ